MVAAEGMVQEVVADVVAEMVELFAGEEGTLGNWIEDVSEKMVGEVEGAEWWT